MVGARLIPSKSQRELRKGEVNCVPLPEVIVFGTPNRVIQFEKIALTVSAVEVVEDGTASDQRVDLSMMVKR